MHIRSSILIFSALTALGSMAIAQSQSEMNAQLAAKVENEDAIMNSAYRRIMKERAGETQFCSDLREAQRAWLKLVDFHLKCVFPLKEGEDPRQAYGSIYPSEYAMLKIEMIQARVEQLETLITTPDS